MTVELVRCSPPGFRPGSRPPFFASPKKGGKERRPRCLRPWLRQGCPAVREERAPAQNSLRSLRSLRSNSWAESVHETRCARGPTLLCSSAWHRGGSKQPNTEQPGLHASRCLSAVGCSAVRAAAPMRCRAAQLAWAARASARFIHARPDCLSGANGVSAASFGPAQASEQLRPDTNSPCGLFVPAEGQRLWRWRREPLGAAKGLRIGAVFFAYFLARARK